MRITSIKRPGQTAAPAPQSGSALFALGFRPFYFVAASHGALAIPLWLLVHAGATRMPIGMAPQWWHMHEMVFGFALAVVIGFLFTAVPNWTNRPTPTNGALFGLLGLWIAARVAFQAGLIGTGVGIELVLLVLVAIAIARPLLAAGNRRNLFVIGILTALAAADLAFVLALRADTRWLPDTPLRAALYLIVLLTAIFGGRVIPGFTANTVPGLRQYRRAWLDAAAIGTGAAALLCELADMPASVLAATATAAALLHAARLLGWNPLAARARPLLWILHAAYAWMPIGFALLAGSAMGWIARPLATHAFAVGLIGGLIIGMITRTALGHTGRPLVAGRAEQAMYWLVMFAALARVGAPLLAPGATGIWTTLSGLAWSSAFALYAVVYWPRLSQPRVG